jgi:hypothetical protein
MPETLIGEPFWAAVFKELITAAVGGRCRSGWKGAAQRVRAPPRAVGGAGAVCVLLLAARFGAVAAHAPGNQTAVYCSMASRSPVNSAPSHGG